MGLLSLVFCQAAVTGAGKLQVAMAKRRGLCFVFADSALPSQPSLQLTKGTTHGK